MGYRGKVKEQEQARALPTRAASPSPSDPGSEAPPDRADEPSRAGTDCRSHGRAWLRRFFEVNETRISARLYLHQDLDLDAAEAFWSTLANIAIAQFQGTSSSSGSEHSPNKEEHGGFSVWLRTLANAP